MTKKLLMGNEAFAHAALEAGVRVVAGYPGTPSSELIETVARLRASGAASDVYVEWSTNEKAALEVAFGASLSGARALFTCKQVGLNVASDALMSLNYVGVRGGLVLFVADDPGPISSQTEQDTRRFASFAKVPVLDPATPEQGYEMMKAAFELSETYKTPVIVRPTTRINHASTFFDVPDFSESKPLLKGGFKHDSSKLVIFPKRSYEAHGEINQRLRDIARDFSTDPQYVRFNLMSSQSGSRLGILVGGVSAQYAREALMLIQHEARTRGVPVPCCRFLQMGTPYPFPKRLASRFLEGLSHVLVLEELDSVLEEELLKVAATRFLSAHVHGKLTGAAPARGENSTETCARAIARFFDAHSPIAQVGRVENLEKSASRAAVLPEKEPEASSNGNGEAPKGASGPASSSISSTGELLGQNQATGTIKPLGSTGSSVDPSVTAPFEPVFPKHSKRMLQPSTYRRKTSAHAARYKAPISTQPLSADVRNDHIDASASMESTDATTINQTQSPVRSEEKQLHFISYEKLVMQVIDPAVLLKYEGELPSRPPVLCSGCPHRGSFYAVKTALHNLGINREDSVFCGDIGCYTLGNAAPLDAADTCLCMGAGITMAQGLSVTQPDKKNIAFVGDSTFFASGLTGIVNAVYNQHDVTICILDNSTTAMTGSQPHPGTGATLMGGRSNPINIEGMLEAMGVEMIVHADPLNKDQAIMVSENALRYEGPSAILFESPCIWLKPFGAPLEVDSNRCTGCKRCITDIGCPAIGFDANASGPRSGARGQAVIDADQCNGCRLCSQVCPFNAIGSPSFTGKKGRELIGDDRVPYENIYEPVEENTLDSYPEEEAEGLGYKEPEEDPVPPSPRTSKPKRPINVYGGMLRIEIERDSKPETEGR